MCHLKIKCISVESLCSTSTVTVQMVTINRTCWHTKNICDVIFKSYAQKQYFDSRSKATTYNGILLKQCSLHFLYCYLLHSSCYQTKNEHRHVIIWWTAMKWHNRPCELNKINLQPQLLIQLCIRQINRPKQTQFSSVDYKIGICKVLTWRTCCK